MVRLPLQVGTTATWAAARIALGLFPGLALLAVGVLWFFEDGAGEVVLIPLVLGYATWR